VTNRLFLRSISRVGAILLTFGAVGATTANAANVLIVGETFTNDRTTHVASLHSAAGNSATVTNVFPVNTAGYDQIWDLRVLDPTALSVANQATYLSFLQGGGGLFLSGENTGFVARNNSLLAMINVAGGGSLTTTTPAAAQTVFAPFNAPNPLTTLSYAGAGGVTGFGTGQWITASGSSGTGVAWATGTLANASSGYMAVMFDSNTFQPGAPPNNQALTRNLIAYFNTQGAAGVVPEPATWALMISGFGMTGTALRRRRRIESRRTIMAA
jgi:hypothetical protein